MTPDLIPHVEGVIIMIIFWDDCIIVMTIENSFQFDILYSAILVDEFSLPNEMKNNCLLDIMNILYGYLEKYSI